MHCCISKSNCSYGRIPISVKSTDLLKYQQQQYCKYYQSILYPNFNYYILIVINSSSKCLQASTYRKTNLRARCECLHLIKINFRALPLDENIRSELIRAISGKGSFLRFLLPIRARIRVRILGSDVHSISVCFDLFTYIYIFLN